MKKVLKFVGWFVIALIVFGIIMSMVGGGGSDNNQTSSEPKQEAPKKEKAADPINQANYDKIVQGDALTGEGGMTIAEVKAILGEPDSESESQSGDIVMKTMSWSNLKLETVSVTFINEKVSSKTYLK